nr:HK97 gp10 family phage protein [uncultured Acetatifactor sp.]
MAGKYVRIDATELRRFVERLNQAGRGKEFEKELSRFLDAIAVEFLSYVQDFIIQAGSVDTRLLLNSFQKSGEGSVFIAQEGGLQIEVGTNVEYASFVNDGHWLNPKGVDMRWVPGEWQGERFIYQPGAKTGMLLKQKWIEGSHYFDDAIRLMERMAPQFMERKMQQWLEQYFSDFV